MLFSGQNETRWWPLCSRTVQTPGGGILAHCAFAKSVSNIGPWSSWEDTEDFQPIGRTVSRVLSSLKITRWGFSPLSSLSIYSLSLSLSFCLLIYFY